MFTNQLRFGRFSPFVNRAPDGAESSSSTTERTTRTHTASVNGEGFFSHVLGVNTTNGTPGKVVNIAGRAALATMVGYGIYKGIGALRGGEAPQLQVSMGYAAK